MAGKFGEKPVMYLTYPDILTNGFNTQQHNAYTTWKGKRDIFFPRSLPVKDTSTPKTNVYGCKVQMYCLVLQFKENSLIIFHYGNYIKC